MSSEKKDIIMQGSILREALQREPDPGGTGRGNTYESLLFLAAFKKNSGENFKDYLNKVRMKTCDQPAGIH